MRPREDLGDEGFSLAEDAGMASATLGGLAAVKYWKDRGSGAPSPNTRSAQPEQQPYQTAAGDASLPGGGIRSREDDDLAEVRRHLNDRSPHPVLQQTQEQYRLPIRYISLAA